MKIKNSSNRRKIIVHLCWNICATNARLRFGEPSVISFGLKYLLQSNFSACSSTIFALTAGSFVSNAVSEECSGARDLIR
jgi:hypothetical protein